MSIIDQLKSAIPDAGLTIGHYADADHPNDDRRGPFAETLERTIAVLESR